MWLFLVFVVFWLLYYGINTRIYYSLEIHNNQMDKYINNIYILIVLWISK